MWWFNEVEKVEAMQKRKSRYQYGVVQSKPSIKAFIKKERGK